MIEAAIRVGVETDWIVDVVQSAGRALIVNPETNLVIGEILPDGATQTFPEPYPYDPYEGEDA